MGNGIAAIAEGEIITIEHVIKVSSVDHVGIGSDLRGISSYVKGFDDTASFHAIAAELRGYTELLQEARDEAIKRMQSQAQQLGANAVVNVRFSTSSVAAGAAEIYVYGTAVTVG